MYDIEWAEPLGAWDDDPEARARRAAAAEVIFGATPADPEPAPRPLARGPWFGRRPSRPRHLAAEQRPTS